jgi:hypothetical protein
VASGYREDAGRWSLDVVGSRLDAAD